jgi:uncharacterized membrane protein YcaP (DUF421 family)
VEDLWEQFRAIFGSSNSSTEVSAAEVALRCVVVYCLALIIVRLGSKRFLSKASAFDVVVAIMLGSIMSRGIDGRESIIVTIVAGGVLVAMHWLFGFLSFYTDWFGRLVKGERLLLIKDGQIQEKGMRKGSITERDLAQALRMQTNHRNLARVKRAYLERNGEISIVSDRDDPQVIDVSVENGVETIRIEMR